MRWSHMLGVTFICDGSESMPETTLFWPGGNHHGCLTIHYVWQQAKLAWTHGPWWFRSMWKFETFHVMLFFFSILFCYQSIPLGWQGFQITNLDAFYPLFTKPYSPTQTKRLDFFFFSNRNLNKNRPVAHVVRGTLQWWYEYWCLVVTTPEHRLGKSSLNAYRGVTLYCFIRIRKKEIHVI